MTDLRRLRLLPIIVACAATASCAPKQPTPAELQQGPLAFVQDGKTTREEAILQLGSPTAEFEADRILTFRVTPRADGGIETVDRDSGDPYLHGHAFYSLVLVFDARGVLKKHSLVPMR